MGGRHSAISVCGHTDLTLVTCHSPLDILLKFSGNSQRRRKHFLLFHGTFLLNLDLALVCELLPMPSKQPDYRKHRTHDNFLTNLNLPTEKVKAALQKAWNTWSPLENTPLKEIAALARDKYASPKWNQRF